MADESVWNIAKYILAFSHEHGDPVSNLKLQKLLYYAQAWYLAFNSRPLFDDRIEAWAHGPAVPPVYGEFKKWGWRPIDEDPGFPELEPNIREHMDDVMDVYGPMAAYQLEQLTHNEEPWREARAGLPPEAPSNAVIDPATMGAYYRARLNGKDQDSSPSKQE